MTKSQEITILNDAIVRLGTDSYLGAWIAELIPTIRQDIESDHRPIITRADSAKAAAAIIEDARKQSADMLAQAIAKADRFEAIAINERNIIEQQIRKSLDALRR